MEGSGEPFGGRLNVSLMCVRPGLNVQLARAGGKILGAMAKLSELP